VRLALIEALTFARRLARRRVVVTTLALDAALALWLVASPVDSERAAATAAQGLGVLTALVLASGCIADDRVAGRLLLGATHPAPPSTWVLGRWLAVATGACAVTLAATVLITLAGPGFGRASAFGAAVGCVHLAALAALAALLSTTAGATAQMLALLGVLLIGLVPPDVLAGMLAAPWLETVARVAWAALPTPWALDRLQAWAAGLEGPHLVLLLALLAQPPLALALGARTVARAELGARAL
jgi:hypothetical protein